MLRCFIAIDLSPTVLDQIAALQQELKKSGQGIRWVRTANIHLTLKFLGDVPAEQVNPIAEALTRVGSLVKPFEFEVRGAGFFPNARKARILWVGVNDSGGHAANLFHEIEDELIHFGFSRENRKFTPHLTIGRVKSKLNSDFIEKIRRVDFNAGRVEANDFSLVKSELKPGGAVYTPLEKISLINP